MKLTIAEQFFYEHAGFGYDPRTQTAEEGKIEGAKQLAEAETWARNAGVSFEWVVDPDADSREFAKGKQYPLWGCIAHDGDASTESLWGIDFGRDKEPYGEPYKRVVEAELAIELLAAHEPPEAQSGTAYQMLKGILSALDEMGIGSDAEVDGADAVDYLNALREQLKEFLK